MPKKQSIGKTFHVGSYLVTVEDVIAEGGFALVFLTRDQMGRRFALKRSFVNTEADVIMCQQEIRILETLGKDTDSYIVKFLASAINVIDEEVKEVLILLEYYKYSVLQLMNERFQAKRNLTEEEILNIFCDVCHAVGKLHSHRPAWAHRDLKVENILIDKDGHCVLCDFGSCTTRILDPLKQPIADIEEDLKKYTTIAYRSPEMVNLYGYKKPVTTKADIWALGVMLYKMAYFTLPFGESSLAIQNCNLQFPSAPAYSKQLTGLIRYCLKVNPDDRPEIFQVASLTCSLINRDCLVPNATRCPVPPVDILLNQPESSQVVPVPFLETSPPRIVRPPTISSQEFSSTTSIAPRERPKASTPAASSIVLLPALRIPNGNSMAAVSDQSRDGQAKHSAGSSSRPGNAESAVNNGVSNGSGGSPFRPVAGAVNPFRDAVNASPSWVAPFPRPDVPRPTRMGHRRNTSDTSMVPVARPLSPTPTQNVSEKSRSADTSPVRSPYPGGEVEKKFSNWNPFEDAEVWAHAPAPQTSAASVALGLAQSVSSLVRGGSISSASRTTLGSPTGENGEKAARATKSTRGVASDVKKEKKKFRYQKFDNDSEEELMPSDGGEEGGLDIAGHKRPSEKSASSTPKVKDKDTDSIGSASDLKHDDDTTDDEKVGGEVTVHVHHTAADHADKTEEEDNTAYDSVQYGTLEETTSAIQSQVSGSHKSILQETSSKPLLDSGFDKSDDDELERGRPLATAQAQSHVPQRRLTFEAMGLLSVFDQIPFRYPKKSKTFATFKGTESQDSQRLTDEAGFAETNPFLSSFSTKSNAVLPTPGPPTTDSSHDFENIAGRYHHAPTESIPSSSTNTPIKLPPPVPPKPTFLRTKDSNHNYNHPPKSDVYNDVFSSFDGPSFADHALSETLVDVDDAPAVRTKSAARQPRSPVFQEAVPLFTAPLYHHSQSQSGSTGQTSPKLSKSPTRRSSRRIVHEGISNISFEDT
ncbi:AP2-associated protein kinase 1 [Hypsibius exemplaris]|uniref:non-specific serine/threonine protein kinase n=1 Tax=Hypsibius exemplaris TaxID=2072580 RepID=A0A1W0XB70_HYPEX|nr:AP2-associated protein kinase 1 [Hypsibius exemplaris]